MDNILRKESSAEYDDHRLSPIELNEDVCSVLFNSINVRQFRFLSLWKITCEYSPNYKTRGVSVRLFIGLFARMANKLIMYAAALNVKF
jgi:hypothetical protein